MTRTIQLLAALLIIAVPVAGWFAGGWSGGTTLVVYWFETVAASVLISARIGLHRRWAPRRGHFRYQAAGSNRRGSQSSSFLVSFSSPSFAFCAAHAVFLTVILFMLHQSREQSLAGIDWRSVGFACMLVLVFLAVDFGVDLLRLRQWSFLAIEQLAHRGLDRVVVVHLTLIFGLTGIAVTSVSDALFGIFIVLKTLAALSWALPQWEPTTAPEWLTRIMNRVPNVHPGRRFEEIWAEDRRAESTRRERNDQQWVPQRG